ncbi:phosphoethanolamine transferase [Photobacterium aphoticum]|uniref:Hydrolase n=1 Tax=Photobacterium aphoticum TaxID=754436 RepID=A0A0J1GIJ8_9GAMM|nr:phosphoethanolamine--lipid A transferase [Photobacterium aphoticum]KLU99542.1 hydrolase [Photobacterium aphoticum]PSU57083.1 phosphoethanolamine transferase [Photobacterium aphoticum]GHA53197.1 phosphoethanolamine transferase [Photobacterium aphoticum]
MQRRLRSMGFTLLIALYFTVFQNMALWHHLSVLYAAQKVQGWGFLLTVPVFIFVLMNVVFTLLIWPRVYKVIVPVLILAATGVTYAMYQYGVVFDHGMMVNVVETDTHEATSYLSPALFGWFIGLAVIPLILLWRVKVDFGASTRQLILKKGMSILLSLVVVGAIAGLYYKDYASLLRNHSEIKAMINPTNFLSAGYRVLKERVYEAHLPFEVIGTDAVDRNAALAEKGKPNVLVLVVGETARAQDYALDGYDRNTNPYLSKESILSYQNVSSCGTATAVSVPCMFSRMTHDNYDALTARHQEGLLDVLKHAGVSVTWIDNNSGSKGVANRVNVIITQGSNDPTLCPDGMCYDGILLKPLKQQLAHIEGDTVIVLHLMGSHGPTYAKRYPKAFARFKPVCETSDLQQCSQEALINTYDNSLVYTDYILDQIIGLLKEESSKVNGAMLYMSDHGESLGEQGIYLHGMPYSIAPSQQTHIPMITWFSPTFTQHQRLDGQCMSQVAQHDKLSHDNVFHTVLGMMDISTNTYDPHLDMLAACRQ